MKERHEEPEVMEERLSSGASGAAGKEEGTIQFEMKCQKCSVFGSVLSNVTNVSPDAQKEEDKDDKTSSSQTPDEEVNRQRRHNSIDDVILVLLVMLNLLVPPPQKKYRTRMRKGGLKMRS